MPLFTVLLSSFGIFLYLLPGMCDPENNTDRRAPFLILSYFVIIFLFCIMVNINESILSEINGYVLYFPFIILFLVHLVTMAVDLNDRRDEVIIVLSLLFEAIIFALI